MKANQLKEKLSTDQDQQKPNWLSQIMGTNKKIKTSKTERGDKYKKMSSATIESSLESEKMRLGG